VTRSDTAVLHRKIKPTSNRDRNQIFRVRQRDFAVLDINRSDFEHFILRQVGGIILTLSGVAIVPVVAIILGAALLEEKLTVIFIAGFVAVLIGVLLVNWPTKIVTEPLPDAGT